MELGAGEHSGAKNFQVAVRFLEKLDPCREECIIPFCVVRTFGSFFVSTVIKLKFLWKTGPKIMKSKDVDHSTTGSETLQRSVPAR